MSRIVITGSSDGIGREAARQLIAAGHEVVVHGRTQARAAATAAGLPGAAGTVWGDLASLAETRALAEQLERLGPWDVVVHNAGVGYSEPARIETEDGLAHVFQVNVLAPYLLTALLPAPGRLVFLSSGIHRDGGADLDDLQWERRAWNGYQAYCDSKLLDTVLAAAVARRRPDAVTLSVEPGWVRTKMGGPDAPGTVEAGADAEVWHAVREGPLAADSGRHFDGRHAVDPHPAVADVALQDALLARCAQLTGVELPG